MKYTIIIFCLLSFVCFKSIASEDFEYEKQKELGRQLRLKSDEIIIPPPPENIPTPIHPEIYEMMRTGISTVDEYEFDPLLMATEDSNPNERRNTEITPLIDPSELCPPRPKRSWNEKSKKLVCRADLTEKDTNIKKEKAERELIDVPIYIRKTIKELPPVKETN